ncbi:histone-lysine N-methyltransferase, H3 lysine-9 specific SUVH6-like [Olea europaea subsp. europaea]|uniref:Histone-lysine N-methyltransferase, H3 lysine-9 specific SUVH6-like n=1 Tax=Olea europaea subsp. europaea TaxID=158383 RepID=A0A8S0SZ20_OLEEU|nr:histone-lysine N-methyltransferase, H3 lysine-9 specific SUVH6-like [Olea europaea subsp. europaea]
MVSLSNGGSSCENPNKRPMQNSNVPKYKPRKVSAVRDFPSGCGPNAMPGDVKLREENSNGVKNSELAYMMGANEVENSVMPNIVEASGVRDAEISQVMVPDAVNNSEIMNVVVPRGVKIPETEIEGCQDIVVNNPVEIEMTESTDVLVGKVVTTATDDLSNWVEELMMGTRTVGVELQNDLKSNSMKEVDQAGGQKTILEGLNGTEGLALAKNTASEEAKPGLDIGASIDRMDSLGGSQFSSSPKGSIAEGSVKIGTSFRREDKFRRRKVSAVRDFPPLCGRNAPRPIQEGRQTVACGKACLDAIENTKTETDVTQKLRNNLDREALREVPMISGTKCLERVEKIEVNSESIGTMRDIAGGGSSGEIATGVAKIDAFHNVAGNTLKSGLTRKPSDDSFEELGIGVQDGYFKETKRRGVPSGSRTLSKPVLDYADEDAGGPVGRDIVVYSTDRSDEARTSQRSFISTNGVNLEIVHALMAAPNCPWTKDKSAFSHSRGGKVRRQSLSSQEKSKPVTKKSSIKRENSGGSSLKKKRIPASSGNPGALIIWDEKNNGACNEEVPANSPSTHKPHDFDVSLPPFGPKSSSHTDIRNRVRETLRLFHSICRKLLQGEEAKSIPEEERKSKQPEKSKRIDLRAAQIIKDRKMEVNTEKQILGEVPGVEVGDEFQYRVELAIVGIHRLYQAGIDSMKLNDVLVATSIVSSGVYFDDTEDADVLMYSGEGGNVVGKNKQPEDQKLLKGNLALWNCIAAKTPVRVIRGWKTKPSDSLDSRSKLVTTYVYDGLYTVTECREETGPHGKMVFLFELRRNPGQPELAWKELKKSNKHTVRPGICVNDISEGKEPLSICAVNTVDSEKPPPFNYVPKMMYPAWHQSVAPEGCDCSGRCSDSRKCRCVVKNGGEIPYNRNGAIVEAKALVYECGPSCKCPPSCYNRVSQRGIKFRLEIFKTESRGWGVRSLNSIPSGSFICEYAGELLEDKEAEQKIGNDEYLFDIGHNYMDSSLRPEEPGNSLEVLQEGCYTIDAAQHGNIGRFINHSCSPNLYAQNVIYDHDDKRMPHVMFFAAENIPPLQELTYHYNYTIDQVRDSNGNIKIKKCYCGTAECTGRMY